MEALTRPKFTYFRWLQRLGLPLKCYQTLILDEADTVLAVQGQKFSSLEELQFLMSKKFPLKCYSYDQNLEATLLSFKMVVGSS